jgi:hypothetical protein
MAIVSGRKTVTAAGTAEALSATSVAINRISIMAETDNTNPVTVGGSDVVGALATRKGVALRATDPPVTLYARDGVDELGDVFVDAITNGDGVTFIYTTG